jgi:hypothetical protein
MLRAHLHRCVAQLATIAGMKIPTIPAHMRYDESWQLEAYARPAFASSPPAVHAAERSSHAQAPSHRQAPKDQEAQ